MSNTRTAVRIVADYQMFGDMPGQEWAELVLNDAKKAGLISDFHILCVFPGIYGLQYISFWVDTAMTTGLSWDDAKDRGATLVNRIVGDTDASMRWMTVFPEKTDG